MPRAGIGVGLALCIIAQAPFFASNALADSAADLIQDIKAHIQTCGPVGPDTHPSTQLCTNEQAQLVKRQTDLNLSNDDINKQIKTRGSIGGWYPTPIPRPK
jgi:hypothetical protein